MSILHLTTEPSATHQGADWNRHTKSEVYQSSDDDYTTVIIINDKVRTEIQYRNVGKLNEQSSIQFTVTEYTFSTNRTKRIDFSIPFELSTVFITGLTKVKTQ